MPELPEVETVRAGLQKLVVGKTVKSVESDWAKSFPNDGTMVQEFLLGAKVIAVKRRAKVLIIDLDSGYSLVVHLKMTGQLVFVPRGQTQEMGDSRWGMDQNDDSKNIKSTAPMPSTQTPNPKGAINAVSQQKQATSSVDFAGGDERWGGGHPNDSLISNLPDKSTRVIIEFNDASRLYFNDQRKFGWMKLLPSVEVPNIDFMQKVGPEPLEPGFTTAVLKSQLGRRKNSNIKAALLDQTTIAGIGNIYADESLFLAGIHPESRTGAIPKSRINMLHSAIIAVLNLSIEKGGSTDRNYISAEGKKGSYIDFANVFRKDNQPCPRCGNIIIKIRVAGRGTHVCRKCQRKYK